jgi:hypothetical protein
MVGFNCEGPLYLLGYPLFLSRPAPPGVDRKWSGMTLTGHAPVNVIPLLFRSMSQPVTTEELKQPLQVFRWNGLYSRHPAKWAFVKKRLHCKLTTIGSPWRGEASRRRMSGMYHLEYMLLFH